MRTGVEWGRAWGMGMGWGTGGAQRGASLPSPPAPHGSARPGTARLLPAGRCGAGRGGSGRARSPGADKRHGGRRSALSPRPAPPASAPRAAAHGAARPARHGPLRGGAPPHRECLQGESATGARRRVSPFSCSWSSLNCWISPPRDARGQSGLGRRRRRGRPWDVPGAGRGGSGCRGPAGTGHEARGTVEPSPGTPSLVGGTRRHRDPRGAVRGRGGQRCPRITPERGSPSPPAPAALPQARATSAFLIPWSSRISQFFLFCFSPRVLRKSDNLCGLISPRRKRFLLCWVLRPRLIKLL